ncbi:MAG: phosphoribosylformimino-5-aminoimidazole carboxamide ribotide isomerase [Victivallaceae bacterium]|nr:phosphoribosylformimino-5-aminoimidazole carboxamide ribotide isomerase [Victivallaceae bacterium]
MSRLRPCIDLHEGRVKQIVGGTLTDKGAATNFVSDRDPAYFAELYRRYDLRGGHVIKLGPGNDAAARAALAAWPGGLQVGGGITAANAAGWIAAGAGKVIVTSFVFSDGELKCENLNALLDAVGREHLVLDLSCRRRADGDYFVVTDRWQKFTNLKIEKAVFEELAASSSEFLVHAVDVEGRRAGVDARLLNMLADYSPIPCVYAGGVASLDDVELIEQAGGGRVDYTVGSALDIFGGDLAFDALAVRGC